MWLTYAACSSQWTESHLRYKEMQELVMKDTWEGMSCSKTHQWVLDQQHQAGDDKSSSKPKVKNDRGNLQVCTVTLCEQVRLVGACVDGLHAAVMPSTPRSAVQGHQLDRLRAWYICGMDRCMPVHD